MPKVLLTLLVILLGANLGAQIPQRVELAMPEGPHPNVFLTQNETEAVRRRAAQQDWAAAIAADIVQKADKLVSDPLDIPHAEGQWSHWYSCADDGGRLKAKSPTEHVCPICGKVYSGDPYDSVYVANRHDYWLGGIEALGIAYLLNPKPGYAERAREILLEYASFYDDLQLHDIYGKLGTAKGKLHAQTLNEAVTMCDIVLGYDIMHDAPCFTDEDHRTIAGQLIRPMVRTIQANNRGLSNWQTWHNAAVCSAGLLLGDRELVDWSINGRNGLLYQLQAGSVMESGMWYEESPSYHWYAFTPIIFQLEGCKRAGMDFYRLPIIEKMFAAPVRQLLPDKTLVPFHDSNRSSITSEHRFYEIGYREYTKPLYAALARPRKHVWSLIWGVDELPEVTELPAMASSNDESEGLAVLRSPDNQIVAFLDYGPGQSGHVQNAKLNIVLFAHGDIRFVDPGRLPYGNPMHAKWFKQTIAHNTIIVNEETQRKAPGKLKAWADAEDYAIVRAECGGAYPGVKLDRTLMMKGNLIADIFTCNAETSSTFDLPLHILGELKDLPQGRPVNPFSEKNGYGVLMDVAELSAGPKNFVAAMGNGRRIAIQTFDYSRAYTALGYGTSSLVEKVPMLIRRQQGNNATFVAVYQILGEGEAPAAVQWNAETGELTTPEMVLRVSQENTEYKVSPAGDWINVNSVPQAMAAEKTDSGNRVRLDFGSIDVAESYEYSDGQTFYGAGRTYGWQNAGKLNDDVQHKPEALDPDFARHRDFTWSRDPAEFRMDLQPGIYRISFTTGDINIGEPATKVTLNQGNAEFPLLKPKVREYITATAAIEVKQSPLIITFSTEDKNNWQVNTLIIEPSSETSPVETSSTTVRFFERGSSDPAQLKQPVQIIASNYPRIDSLTKGAEPPIAPLWALYVEEMKNVGTYEPSGTTRDVYLRHSAKSSAAPLLEFLSQKKTTPSAESLTSVGRAFSAELSSLYRKEKTIEWLPVLAEALVALKRNADPDQVAQWTEAIEDLITTNAQEPSAFAAQTILYYGGVSSNPPDDAQLASMLNHFSSWGLYTKDESSVQADALARLWLSLALTSGYMGESAAELSDYLLRGAHTSLFLRTLDTEDAVTGAARAATYEIYAMYYAARAEKEAVGTFKRAAHLSALSNNASGTDQNADENLAAAILQIAYHYARHTEAFVEYPAPAEISYLIPPREEAFMRMDSTEYPRKPFDAKDKAAIRNRMMEVFEYAVAHPRLDQHHGWEKAVFRIGMMEAYLATRDEAYLREVQTWSEEAGYDFFEDRRTQRDADNQACGQVYADLYLLQGGEEKLAKMRAVLDQLITEKPEGRKLWWWCDSLFMAPPAYVKLAEATGDGRYRELLNNLWWDAKEFLYDEEEHLFFRDYRYFDARTENGRKVFWSRGNGWVLAGLARVLTHLPKDDPRYQDYVSIYREMAGKIAEIQGPDGMWRTSLIDSEEYPMPETSGTAFYTYALAWGINNDVLNQKEFLPAVQKGWKSLNQIVYPSGRIGWVQHQAAAPGMIAPEMTREYAPGAYLLAASELLRME